MNAAMKVLDTDSSGVIEFEEFVDWWVNKVIVKSMTCHGLTLPAAGKTRARRGRQVMSQTGCGIPVWNLSGSL